MMNLVCFALAAFVTLFVDGYEKDGVGLPVWIMMHFTGYIMRSAATTL